MFRTLKCPRCSNKFNSFEQEAQYGVPCPKCEHTVNLLDSDTVVHTDHHGEAVEFWRTLQIDGYEIVGMLGKGGMGVVVEARQTQLSGRRVAIKILPPTLAADPQFIHRFDREINALASLNHPNIVSIRERGKTADNYLYFIMEYVEGLEGDLPTDLKTLLRTGPLAPETVKQFALSISDALGYAHERGIVHRDIKPGNVLIGRGKNVRVADFGIACMTETRESQLTYTNAIIGTPDYMSPEQRVDSGNVDHRTDVYALGVLVYEMLTGRIPHGNYKIPSLMVPGLNPKWDELIDRALQPNVDERLQNMSEFRQFLESISERDPTTDTSSGISFLCPGCSATLHSSVKFCPTCRTEQWIDCDKCGAHCHASIDFCTECGFDLQNQKRLRKLLDQATVELELAGHCGGNHVQRCEHAIHAGIAAKRGLNMSPRDAAAQKLLTQANDLLQESARKVAEQALDEKNLNRSLHYWELVLDVDPQHSHALQRIAKIHDFRKKTLQQAAEKRDSGELELVESILQKLSTMFPEDSQVAEQLTDCRNKLHLCQRCVTGLADFARRNHWFGVKAGLDELKELCFNSPASEQYRAQFEKRAQACAPLIQAAAAAMSKASFHDARDLAKRAIAIIADHPRGLDIVEQATKGIEEASVKWAKFDKCVTARRWVRADYLIDKLSMGESGREPLPSSVQQRVPTVQTGLSASNRYFALVMWSILGVALMFVIDYLLRLFLGSKGTELSSQAAYNVAYPLFFLFVISFVSWMLRRKLSKDVSVEPLFLAFLFIGGSYFPLLISRSVLATQGDVPIPARWIIELFSLALPLTIGVTLASRSIINPPVRSSLKLFSIIWITLFVVALNWTLISLHPPSAETEHQNYFFIATLWLFAWLQITRQVHRWYFAGLIIMAGLMATAITPSSELTASGATQTVRWLMGLGLVYVPAWILLARKSLVDSAALLGKLILCLWLAQWLENPERVRDLYWNADYRGQVIWGMSSSLLIETMVTVWCLAAAYVAHTTHASLDPRLQFMDRMKSGIRFRAE